MTDVVDKVSTDQVRLRMAQDRVRELEELVKRAIPYVDVKFAFPSPEAVDRILAAKNLQDDMKRAVGLR